MMGLLSGAWWIQRLSGVLAQAIGIVALVAIIIGGLAWLRHDARIDERRALEAKMANARVQQLLLRQRKEKQAAELGARAEKDLLKELDASEAIISELDKKLADRQGQCNPTGRIICFPKKVAVELNR